MIADPKATPFLVSLLAGPSAMFAVAYGRQDLALEILVAAAERYPNALPYDWLRLTPGLEPIRDTPEFARILQLARPAFDERLAVLRAARARGELPEFLEQPLADLERRLGI